MLSQHTVAAVQADDGNVVVVDLKVKQVNYIVRSPLIRSVYYYHG